MDAIMESFSRGKMLETAGTLSSGTNPHTGFAAHIANPSK
jgi:hypothetical protein